MTTTKHEQLTASVTADFYEVIRSRRSVRHYDDAHKMTRDELKSLLAEAVLAPSSSNLQPWRFLVIDEQEGKEKLLPISYNQKQVVEAAAVIAVLGDIEAYKRADEIAEIAVREGYMTEEFAKSFAERNRAGYGGMSTEQLTRIALIDGGLISMQLMLAAKARGLDTVPMGGFHHEQFKEAFGVPDTYVPIMLIAVGKAATEGRPTARLAVEDVTTWGSFISRPS